VLSNLVSQPQLIKAFRLWAAVTHSVLHDRIGSNPTQSSAEHMPQVVEETGKIFQRKMFHILTVFVRLVRRFLLDPVIRAIGFSTSATF